MNNKCIFFLKGIKYWIDIYYFKYIGEVIINKKKQSNYKSKYIDKNGQTSKYTI